MALGIFLGLVGFIITFADFSNEEDNGIRIQTPAITRDDSSAFVRTQEVTFDAPIQLDTAQNKFLLASNPKLMSPPKIKSSRNDISVNLQLL